MSNPTTPFSWQMPQNTDLVTDLPADFEVFGQAVATSMQDLLGGTTGQILSKASGTDMDFTWTSANPGDITGVTAGTGISGGGTSGDVTVTNSMATAFTTSGDLIQATGSGTFARLGTGTNGQYLTTNGTTNSWASVSAGANWSLLNAGGTTLTAASTITVSGISGADKVFILVSGASSASVSSEFKIRFNADSGSNYFYSGALFNISGASFNTSMFTRASSIATEIRFGTMSGGATSDIAGYVSLTGGNSSGIKMIQSVAAASPVTQVGQEQLMLGGYYNSASTISSVSIISSAGNFDNGTIYVYTSA